MCVKVLFCSFILLSSVAHAIPIEFRMDFAVKETGFEHPVGTTAFVSAIYDSDTPQIPSPIDPSDTSLWFLGESLTIGIGDERFLSREPPSINVLPHFLRIEERNIQSMIFVTGGNPSDTLLISNALPTSATDFVTEETEALFYEGTAQFGVVVPPPKVNKERGFELVGVSIGPVPEPSGSLLFVVRGGRLFHHASPTLNRCRTHCGCSHCCLCRC